MPHGSSTARIVVPLIDHLLASGAGAVDGRPYLDGDGNGSRIRADRVFHVPPRDVMNAWTTSTAWERWLRLQSRSRATIAATPGGSFRLEVADTPVIHVITGDVSAASAELLELSWLHDGVSDSASRVTVTVRESSEGSIMTFVHDRIANRREASWLMRLWPRAHRRLAELLEGDRTSSKPADDHGAFASSFVLSSNSHA